MAHVVRVDGLRFVEADVEFSKKRWETAAGVCRVSERLKERGVFVVMIVVAQSEFELIAVDGVPEAAGRNVSMGLIWSWAQMFIALHMASLDEDRYLDYL